MIRNKLLLTVILLTLIITAGATAQESDVVYIDGWVDIKDSSGDVYELFIGDRIYFGDTVITGEDGVAELEPESGSRIIIQPDTVFSIKETNFSGKRQSVASTTLGQVSFKFNRMTSEPLISTPSTVMGVRGTEFTVYAAADGSALVAVESGAVEVSGQGESVLLSENEGVEVQTGAAPGEKFEIKGKALDFTEWNSGKIAEMIGSPIEKLTELEQQLTQMADNAWEWKNRRDELAVEIENLKAERKKLFDAGKDDEAKSLQNDKLRPLEIDSLRCVMNYRYYALTAMSFRQHILSGFYLRMKTSFINETDDKIYKNFLVNYDNLIEEYHNLITPLLVEADY